MKPPPSEEERELERTVGLCARCEHLKRVVSARGSVFYQCRLAATDPRFAKFPPLPVRVCAGFDPTAPGGVTNAPP